MCIILIHSINKIQEIKNNERKRTNLPSQHLKLNYPSVQKIVSHPFAGECLYSFSIEFHLITRTYFYIINIFRYNQSFVNVNIKIWKQTTLRINQHLFIPQIFVHLLTTINKHNIISYKLRIPQLI